MAPELVVLDLDGTLLRPDGSIPAASLAALRAVVQRGIQLALCTGRSTGSTRYFAAHLAAAVGRPVPAVACGGAAVLDGNGRLITHRAMPTPLLVEALTVCRASDLLVVAYGPESLCLEAPWRHLQGFIRLRRGQLLGLWRGLGAAWRFWRVNRVQTVRNLVRWAGAQRPAVLKIFAFHPATGPTGRVGLVPGDDQAAVAAVRAALAARAPSLHCTSSARGNLELMPPGAHKGWGLRVLAEVLHVPRAGIMAVGDGHNDLEMLEYAGLPVAMGGAPEPLLAVAAHVTGSLHEDGLAAALQRFCL